MHHGDPVRDGERLLLVVRHEHRRDAETLLDVADLLAHADTQLRVEVRQRLVEQQQPRALHERASKRCALLLASGDLCGAAPRMMRQAHEVEHLGDPIGDLATRDARYPQRVGDVLRNAHVGQGIVLKHHGARPLLGSERGDVVAVHGDRAEIGREEPRNHAERRRFAAAGRAEQRHELALCDVEREVVDDHASAECLREAGEAQAGNG